MEEALIKRVMPHDEEADHGGGLLSEADGSRL